MKFYVYVLKEPQTGKWFYIGKGSGNRMFVHEKKILRGDKTHNNHLDNKIRKIHKSGNHVICEKVFETDNEDDALQYETDLIEQFGIENICNMQAGGDGRTPDAETRKKISQNRKGIPVSDETRQKMREAHRGNKHTTEWKENQSKLKKGKPQTEKQRLANVQRSKSLKGRKFSEAHKQKLREAKLKNPTKYWEGKNLPEFMKQKISDSVKKTLNEKINE